MSARIAALLVLLATAGGLVAGCESAEHRRDRALARGAELLAAGNLDKARVEFQNALQAAPNDPSARFGSAQVLDRLGQTRAAAQLYQGTLDVDPAHAAARARLARIYLFAGLPDESGKLVADGLKRRPDDAQLLTVRAALRALRSDRAAARVDAERAVELAPDDADAIAVLAGLDSAEGRYDAARGHLERGVRVHPDSADLRLALAQLEATHGDPVAAERELRELVKRQPLDRGHRVRLAQYLASRGDDAGAEAALREAAAALPAEAELDTALVDFLYARRGRDAALAELDRRLARDPRDSRASFARAAVLQKSGDARAASQVLEDVIRTEGTGAPGLVARTRLAALRAADGERAAAEQLVAAVLAASPRDADALILRGMLLLRDGDARGAIADLRAVLRDQPNATGVLRLLAQAHVVNREPALAEEALRRALEVAPDDLGVAFDLGRMLAQLGRLDQARPLLEKVVKARPDDADAQSALFLANLRAGDLDGARAAANALAAIQPDAPASRVFLGMLAEAESRHEEARLQYERALASGPRVPDALQGLVRALLAAGRRGEALRRIAAVAAAEPGYALPLVIRGDMLYQDRRYDEADRAYAAAAERDPSWWMPVRGRALAAAARSDRPAAIALLEAAVPRVAEPLAVRAELAAQYEAAGRVDDAIRQYDEILRLSPGALVAANNLAMLLVTHRTDRASLQRAGELVAPLADSRDPNYLDTYGWVKLRTGDVATARAALERASALAPESAIVRYHLAMAQLASSRPEDARRNLASALAGDEEYPGRRDAQLALERLGGPPRS